MSLGAWGNTIEGHITWGDRIIVVPFSATAKVGDMVYCKVNGWYKIRFLHSLKNGKFQVKDNEKSRAFTIPFEDIYGQVLEIIKQEIEEYHPVPDFLYDEPF